MLWVRRQLKVKAYAILVVSQFEFSRGLANQEAIRNSASGKLDCMSDVSAEVPKCAFCGTSMDDMPNNARMIQAEKTNAWICEPCLRKSYDLLTEDYAENSN